MSKYLKLIEGVEIEREIVVQDLLYTLSKFSNSIVEDTKDLVKDTKDLEEDIRNSKDEDLIELMLLAYKWWNI